MDDYSPRLVCFSCKFGWGYLCENHRCWDLKNLVPVSCSGKLNTAHIIDAFRNGADGVLILGCPDGECHFQNGNYQARKRVLLLRDTLKDFGIEPERLVIELDLDPEGERIPAVIEEMKSRIKKLGPVSPSV